MERFLLELVLAIIIQKLQCLPDCVRFASVCSSWRRAAKFAAKDKKQFPVPMLLFPNFVLYSVTENRSYRMHLPPLRQAARFCGYSHDWLAVLETDLSITLIKPSPKSCSGRVVLRVGDPMPDHQHAVVIHLPRIRDPNDLPYVSHHPRVPWKVTLYADPSTCSSYVVVALFGKYKRLAVIRSGAWDWTYMAINYTMVDDSFWLDNDLYALTRCHTYIRIHYRYHMEQIGGVSSGEYLRPKEMYSGNHLLADSHVYFIKSSEMLMVESFKVENFEKPTRGFRLHMLSGPRQGQKRKIDGLRNDVVGDALFIGDNCSVTVAAPSSGCKKDCIYYIDYDNDVCVLSLKTSELETLYCPNPPIEPHDWSPIWITPDLSYEWI